MARAVDRLEARSQRSRQGFALRERRDAVAGSVDHEVVMKADRVDVCGLDG